MIPTNARALIESFYAAGRTKYPPFLTGTQTLQVLNDYRDLFKAAAEHPVSPLRDALMQRRLAQIGAIALKALVDVTPDFPEPDPCRCPEPSKSES